MIAKPQDNGRVQPLAAERGPTVLRIALGGQLRQLRESNGISREAAGDAIRGSHAKISRLELGRSSFKERDIRDLLTLYGVVDPDERASFLDLASQANAPGWWHRYNDLLPNWFETYIGLEQAAVSIRTYEAQFVPGLLQTAEYAQAVVGLGHSDADVNRRVEMRMKRQGILSRSQPSTLWAVIDESALRRPVGGVAVLRGQIAQLIEISRRPNVTLQVLPYSVGGHAAAGGPFSILRFAESELPDIVYAEQLTSAIYLDKRQDLELYMSVMDSLSVQAADPDRSVRLLKSIAAEL